ncbi:MAG: hypothetical protein RL095_1025 [Verrucomicrobiota bacterium]|jgi:hypothetical protein
MDLALPIVLFGAVDFEQTLLGLRGHLLVLPVCAVLTALPVLALAAAFLRVRSPEAASRFSRERIAGAVLASFALLWGGLEAHILLGQDFGMITQLLPYLVPAAIVATALWMDYLLARALAGIFLLLVCQLLPLAFAAAVPGRLCLALSLYPLAIAAMFVLGQPWRLRDWLEKTASRPALAKAAAAGLGLATLAFVIPGLLGHVR